MNTFTYKIGNDTYINLTNKCTNDCEFCVRRNGKGVAGYDLWLEREPSAAEIIDELEKDPTDVVFCGFGEPTIKIDELKEIAAYVKRYGGHTRINTNAVSYTHLDVYKRQIQLFECMVKRAQCAGLNTKLALESMLFHILEVIL